MVEPIEEKVSFLEHTLNRFIIHTDKSLYRMEKSIENLSREMREFKDEVRSDGKTMKKQWAELAHKLGSFAEDISLPNIPRIAKEFFNEPEILTILPRVRKRNVLKRGDEYEFDGIVETENKVFLMEAKFTARPEFVRKLPKIKENFRAVFPEYEKKELVLIFGSMSIPEDMVKNLTRIKVYALILGDDNMKLVNFDAIQKKKK